MKKILLLGSGELGKEFVISAQRKGQHIIACDSYAGAPAMQVADEFEVFDMLNGEELERVVKKYRPDIIVPEIEAIRGVSCAHAINKLMEYGLVDEVGRLDAPGRPILFGTTEEFLRSFGVASTEELPMISPDKIEDFKKEAQEEANEITLGLDNES